MMRLVPLPAALVGLRQRIRPESRQILGRKARASDTQAMALTSGPPFFSPGY